MEQAKREIGVVPEGGKAKVKVWAPLLQKVALLLPEKGVTLALDKDEWGYWQLQTDGLKAGDSYQFVLEDGSKISARPSVFSASSMSPSRRPRRRTGKRYG